MMDGLFVVFRTYRQDGETFADEGRAFAHAQLRANVSGFAYHVDGPGYDDAIAVEPDRWDMSEAGHVD